MMIVQHTQGVKIESKGDNFHGWTVVVSDAETGEAVDDIYRVEVTLDVRELNNVRLFYYKRDADGKKYIDETDTTTRNYPELDVYAYAVRSAILCPYCHNEIDIGHIHE